MKETPIKFNEGNLEENKNTSGFCNKSYLLPVGSFITSYHPFYNTFNQNISLILEIHFLWAVRFWVPSIYEQAQNGNSLGEKFNWTKPYFINTMCHFLGSPLTTLLYLQWEAKERKSLYLYIDHWNGLFSRLMSYVE